MSRSSENLARPGKGHRVPGSGRKPGVPNKFTRDVKEAIIQAANKAGGKEGLTGFLAKQAAENPRAFLALLGKVIPLQIEANVGLTLEALVLDAAKRREERDAAAKKGV
ncbi:MAG: hypothetical protein ACLPSW_14465 [Roseiarcus sp.]